MTGHADTKNAATRWRTTGIVDLNHASGHISAEGLRRAGIKLVIHKATEGTDWEDPLLQANAAAIVEAGAHLGLYHYANAMPARAQAAHFRTVARRFPNAILVLDHEDNHRSSYGTMTPEGAAEFLTLISDATGRMPVYYSFTSFMHAMDNGRHDAAIAVMSRAPLWQAQFGEEPREPAIRAWSRIDLWQYTNGRAGPRDIVAFPRTTDGFNDTRQDRSAFGGTVEDLDKWYVEAGRPAVGE
jgi:lysozyme